jgi:hypothetical protein
MKENGSFRGNHGPDMTIPIGKKVLEYLIKEQSMGNLLFSNSSFTHHFFLVLY